MRHLPLITGTRELRSLLALASLLVAGSTGFSQSLTVNTLAGYPGHGNTNGAAGAVRFNNPWGTAIDSSGSVYVADTDNHCIRKLPSGGSWITLAGQPGTNGATDGTGSTATFNQPQGVAVDAVGNVYVADTGNHTIRKITTAGVVTTLAGLAGVTGTNNATGSSARFYEPEGIAVNSAGTSIYVADTWNHTIRLVNAAGTVSTFAGTAGISGTNNATGTSAQFNTPQGVALDSSGNVYVADTGNELVRKITSGGVVTTLAGLVNVAGTNNGTGTAANFWGPAGVAVDSANNVYVADLHNHTIRKITSAGAVTLLAGSPGALGAIDGTASSARFWLPGGIANDTSDTLYIADTGNGTIRKYTGGSVSTIGGTASIGSTDGSGYNARFFWPHGIAEDNSGTSYVADSANSTIRIVNSAGAASTFAGVAGAIGTQDGLSNNAHFYGPQGVTLDASGNVYVSDSANHTIRKITSGGAVSTFAGTAGSNGISDGTNGTARFNYPSGLKADGSGNIYVADSQNHTIRKITPGGVVTTIAGVPGIPGDIDGTSAGTGTNAARFNGPRGVAVDTSGNIFVADTANQTIRKITSGGVVSTLCGMPGVNGSADGTNTDARFNLPTDLVWDFNGNLYVLDSGNHAIRFVTPKGTNWAVTTVAGTMGSFGASDGTGPNAQFCFPAGLAINNTGSFRVADTANNELRATASTFNLPPNVTQQPQDQTVNQGQSANFSVLANGAPTLVYQWRLFGTNIPGATSSAYTRTNCQVADVGPYSVFITNGVGNIVSSNANLTVILAPAITSQPQSTNVNQGDTANFSVTASGTSPAYQWRFNGTNISGANASSYAVTNAQPSDAGNYSVIVSNSAGSVTSVVAALTVNLVNTAPTITVQPQNRTVAQGSNATFTVTATGSTPLSYQWRFNGTNIGTGMASSYTRAGAQPADAGPYIVIVTNLYGQATSSVATLTVVLPPVINLQPSNQLAVVSNSVSFGVGLSQGTSPSYQWYQNGSPVAGATQAGLNFSSITWSNAGAYTVAISNLAGSVTSVVAILKVEQAAFTFFENFESYQPGGLDKNTAGSANTATSNPWWAVSVGSPDGWITNSATGVTPHSGTQMVGATNTVRQDYLNLIYRFNSGQLYYGNFMCDWWFYDLYSTNASGATNMQDYVALCQNAPVSTTSDTAGGSFTTFNQRMSLGTYNGNAGYNFSNYQARIIGGTGGTFGSGNSWYNTATLRSIGWHHARIIMGIPNSTNAAPVSMYIDDMFNPTVSSPSAGTNGFNLIEMNHQFSKLGYLCYYDDLTFRADNDPWIIEQPISQTLNSNQPATFQTVAVGTAYQWQFNGTNIPGATGSSYSIASVQNTNQGAYACLISGANGVLSTLPATLSLIGPAQPANFTSINYDAVQQTISLNMTGTPNTDYVLQSTADLQQGWIDIATVSGTNGTFQYIDYGPATNSQRFYRLRVAP